MNFVSTLLVLTSTILVMFCTKCGSYFTLPFSYGAHKIYSGAEFVKCSFVECCTDEYVSPDIDKLNDILIKELYGQEIARQAIINALRGHLTTNPPKALSMSFHGPPGTGKTYISQLIAKFLYKYGEESKYFHFFNGRNDFPLESKVDEYKEELYKIIISGLDKCERSMFVFDEVDKMPEGLLDVLVQFLDYNTSIKSWRYTSSSINTRKAIYIFLSNTGSSRIIQYLLTLWQQGKSRQAARLQDFEYLTSVGAFNEKGGFHHSDAIQSNVIDHYIPFLPLEETHVRKCLEKAFINRDVNPTSEMIEEGLSYVIFGPPPHNLYATAGCKRLEQKVASIIYAKKTKRTDL
ncbi:torsin-like protein [Ceratina calcarata]|uniref:Torsin-like protein n=1 Tax=Ceratina calcarata TaxID=156304 RepID=A0AAJ7WAU6_9HYME|nr:torsin-like protein [Ceratina calcarata]